jgi:putative hydrolase of the HAD superfamily
VQQFRARLCDSRAWRLYDDAIPTLTRLAAQGWSHQILSNHVPELGDLVRALGLAQVVQAVHCSALTGYEKPHPEAFRGALRAFPPDADVWMVGDNLEADVLGAEACGIRAILVRGADARAARCTEGLSGVERILNGN